MMRLGKGLCIWTALWPDKSQWSMCHVAPFQFSVPQMYVKEGFWISGVLMYSFHLVFGSVNNLHLEAELNWEKIVKRKCFLWITCHSSFQQQWPGQSDPRACALKTEVTNPMPLNSKLSGNDQVGAMTNRYICSLLLGQHCHVFGLLTKSHKYGFLDKIFW